MSMLHCPNEPQSSLRYCISRKMSKVAKSTVYFSTVEIGHRSQFWVNLCWRKGMPQVIFMYHHLALVRNCPEVQVSVCLDPGNWWPNLPQRTGQTENLMTTFEIQTKTLILTKSWSRKQRIDFCWVVELFKDCYLLHPSQYWCT